MTMTRHTVKSLNITCLAATDSEALKLIGFNVIVQRTNFIPLHNEKLRAILSDSKQLGTPSNCRIDKHILVSLIMATQPNHASCIH